MVEIFELDRKLVIPASEPESSDFDFDLDRKLVIPASEPESSDFDFDLDLDLTMLPSFRLCTFAFPELELYLHEFSLLASRQLAPRTFASRSLAPHPIALS